jgi:hypothetical protein
MAAIATNIETIEYRVILVHRDSPAVLALKSVEGYHLPRVRISVWSRPARQLQNIFRSVWGLDVLMLDFLSAAGTTPSFIIAELLTEAPALDFKAIRLGDIPVYELPEEERARLRQLLHGEIGGPFSRAGWLDEALQWAAAATQRTFSSKTPIEQYNAGGAFTLVRFCADDGSHYWLKATGEPNTHESSVTCLLASLCGDYVPTVVASRPDWNAWLTSGEATDVSALQQDQCELSRIFESATESLAELQMRTMGHQKELLEAGALDQRSNVLRVNSGVLFEYMEEAMSLQTSTKAPRIRLCRLLELRETFEMACDYIGNLGIPDSAVHGDMNVGNILHGRCHCQFIDWSETYIGHPLITLQHLLLLNQPINPEVKADRDRVLRQKYRSCLQKVCDPLQIDRGFTCMPLLAAVSALYGRGDWLNSSLRDDPRRQVYARTLTRHMDQAARDPGLVAALRH